MPFKDQQAAIRPETEGRRKLVLATSIAETSLTIEDIRIVVDSGLARRARFDPGTGMAGHAYALWSKGEAGAFAPFAPPEIETADLAGLALELAAWGAKPEELPFLTPPNPASLSEAQALLTLLGAMDPALRITEHGRALAQLPLHPRLAP